MAEDFLTNPVRIDITPVNAAAETVTQWLHPVEKASKPKVLSHLIRLHNWQQVLVYSPAPSTEPTVWRKSFVQDGIDATAIHGNKSQGARTRALAGFKDGSIRVLVATDIAARGLDIEELPQVVNYELPQVPEDYVHRIGRTGRAGLGGPGDVAGQRRRELSNSSTSNACSSTLSAVKWSQASSRARTF